MIVTGTLSDRLEPIISLILLGFQGQQVEIQAVVDTGFNDFLSISRNLADTLGLDVAGMLAVELADGSVHDTNYYPLYVEWMGEQRYIMAQEGEGVPLVGMMLLLDCELRIRVIHNGDVSIHLLAD